MVIGNNSVIKNNYFKYLNVYNILKKDQISKKRDTRPVNKLFAQILENEYDKHIEKTMKQRFSSVKIALLSIKIVSQLAVGLHEIRLSTDVIDIIMNYYESMCIYGLKCGDEIQCIKIDGMTETREYLNENETSPQNESAINEIRFAFYPTLTNLSNFEILSEFLSDLDKQNEIDCIIFLVSLMDYKTNKMNEMIDLYSKLKDLQCLKYVQLTRMPQFMKSLENGIKQESNHLKKHFGHYKLFEYGPTDV